MIDDTITKKMAGYRSKHLIRKRDAIGKSEKNIIYLNERGLLNFTSNDYLGIAHCDEVNRALEGARYGLGSGASPLVCGYSEVHQQLEQEFAGFLKRDSAILFGSGYLANIGVLSALANRDTTIFHDRLCHASLIDGILLSRARHYRFPHNDIHALKSKLTNSKITMIITESIFSMEGDITPIDDLVKLSKSRATLLVDDAHGIGVLGKHGGGITEYAGMSQDDIPILVVPLGKALGSYGAIVSGSYEVINAIKQLARSYIYSTALPPLVAKGTLAALHVLKTQDWRREKLQENIEYFHSAIDKAELTCLHSDATPIKSILVGCNEKAMMIRNKLKHKGLLISAIRPPTVPVNTARLRISLSVYHEKAQINHLISALREHL